MFGKARDKIGAVAGVSGRTLEKNIAVCDAAKAEPEKFGKLLDDMDRTGRVNGVFKRLRVAQLVAQVRAEPPALPGRGPYRVIVADPPWPYEIRREDLRTVRQRRIRKCRSPKSARSTSPRSRLRIQSCGCDDQLSHAERRSRGSRRLGL
jgi:hypothetical protein